MKLYPQPNTAGDPVSGANNFRDVILSTSTQVQFDIKIDQHFSDKSTLSGRYSNVIGSGNTPTVFGDDEFNDGLAYTTRVFNDGLIYSYTPTPRTLLTVDRGSGPGYPAIPHQLPQPDLGRLSQLPGTKRGCAHAVDHHAGSALDIDL